MAIQMTTPVTPAPPATAELTTVLLHHLGAELVAELGGTDSLRVADRWARGRVSPNARGLMRLRIAYEVCELLTAGGLGAMNVREWWESDRALASQGEDASPAGMLRWEPIGHAATAILAAARAFGPAGVELIQWPVTTLVLLDVDGVILPFDPFSEPVETDDLSELKYFQPPHLEPAIFHYDPTVVEAIKLWAALPHVEVQWLTSWGTYVNLLGRQLGLPELPLFDQRTEIDVYRNRPWKKLGLIDFIADTLPRQPMRILWIDDMDIRRGGSQLESMRSEVLLDSLTIEPASHVGLTAEDVARADAFLTGAPQKTSE